MMEKLKCGGCIIPDARYELVDCGNKSYNGIRVKVVGYERKSNKYEAVALCIRPYETGPRHYVVEQRNLKRVFQKPSTPVVKAKVEPFTVDQKHAAFNMVKNPMGWKYPIDKVLDDPGVRNLECLTQAIIDFTGSVPEYTFSDNGKVRIKAEGYYQTIGS